MSIYSCGWGSLSLYLAARFPNSKITGFSNSRSQKEYIDSVASSKSLANLTIITGDVVDYEFTPITYDCVLSIELFEHMKNYELLLAKVSRALKPGGKLFVHIFAHKTTPYDFEDGWMTEHFFTGGTMPSADLLLYFQKDLQVQEQWWVNGMNYAKTCEVSLSLSLPYVGYGFSKLTIDKAWLANMNKNKKEIWPHLEETYGKDKAEVFFYRWQIFYMACAELFAYEGGDVWGVAHYLFEKKAE